MVDNDVLQEAGCVGAWPDAEALRQRLPEIRERLPGADIHTLPYVVSGLSQTISVRPVGAGFSRPTGPSRNQHRHKLARMIGARRAWVVAMIGGDHEQV